MVHLSPVGLATAPVANSLSLLAVFKERLCRCLCTDSSNVPFATVNYRYETPTLNGTTLFVPIVASIAIAMPHCGCDHVESITERFMVAFQGVTTLPTAITITDNGQTQGFSCVVCGKSDHYIINSSITVAITTA